MRSVKRKRVEKERSNGEQLQQMKGVHWKTSVEDEGREIKTKLNVKEIVVGLGSKTQGATRKELNRFWINRSGIEKYGATEGCPGCKAAMNGT